MYHESYSLNSGKKIKERAFFGKKYPPRKKLGKSLWSFKLEKYTPHKADVTTLVFQGGKE
jgi:hypothetical protein